MHHLPLLPRAGTVPQQLAEMKMQQQIHHSAILLLSLPSTPPKKNITVIIAVRVQISIYHHINSQVRAVLRAQHSRIGPRGEYGMKQRQGYEC